VAVSNDEGAGHHCYRSAGTFVRRALSLDLSSVVWGHWFSRSGSVVVSLIVLGFDGMLDVFVVRVHEGNGNEIPELTV